MPGVERAATITYRPGTAEDSFDLFQIFQAALLDLSRRLNVTAITGGDDPDVMRTLWEKRRPLWDHLARTAAEFWVAEAEGRIIGYARSIVRDGTQELTEYFILPGEQSQGVGRELLARAFPPQGARHRSIIATLDMRAQVRYLKAGVYPRFPLQYFSRRPEPVKIEADLSLAAITPSAESLRALAEVDRAVLGYHRDVDHQWLMADRRGYFLRRGGRAAGYAYVGHRSGPMAMLNDADIPDALALAEADAAAHGQEDFGVEVPMINRRAVDHLLKRGYRVDAFIALYMSDAPPAGFENYICTSPPFFV